MILEVIEIALSLRDSSCIEYVNFCIMQLTTNPRGEQMGGLLYMEFSVNMFAFNHNN